VKSQARILRCFAECARVRPEWPRIDLDDSDLDEGDLNDEPPRKHVMWPSPIAWLMGRR